MKETPIVKEIQLDLSNGDVRLYRNNNGEAWTGKSYRCIHGLCIPDPVRVNFGLCAGSSDLIGFSSVIVSQEMVGQRVAIFASVEVKRDLRGRWQAGQREWLDMTRDFGGIAGVARSVQDARRIIYTGGADE